MSPETYHGLPWTWIWRLRNGRAFYWWQYHAKRYELTDYLSQGNLALAEAYAKITPAYAAPAIRRYVQMRMDGRMRQVMGRSRSLTALPLTAFCGMEAARRLPDPWAVFLTLLVEWHCDVGERGVENV